MHRPVAEPRKTKHRRTALREWLASESSGDVMLAQKIALEIDETAALKVANKFGESPPAALRPRGARGVPGRRSPADLLGRDFPVCREQV
jgi:hypothetical protein